jgi:hypothetical protein
MLPLSENYTNNKRRYAKLSDKKIHQESLPSTKKSSGKAKFVEQVGVISEIHLVCSIDLQGDCKC